MTISRLRNITGAAIAGLLMTPAPAGATYGQTGEPAAAKEAAARSPDCEQTAARAKVDNGRIVYVGPRQNVKMRIGGDKAKKETSQACLADRNVEVRTVYVGPRQNVSMKIVKSRPKDD
ncbi:MAG: hypothetical protein WD076_11225 [Parvularculaceae bacterium]